MKTQIFNLQWLEENLGFNWEPALELECRKIWGDWQTGGAQKAPEAQKAQEAPKAPEASKARLIESYPTHAFLLILRDYMMGSTSDSESRLRQLIPVLSRLGDSGLALSALVLLGVLILDRSPNTPVVDTIVRQVSPEIGSSIGSTPGSSVGSTEHTLHCYLLGQIAVKEGRFDAADHHYDSVMTQPFGMYEALNFLLGRMYQKIGIYLLRTGGHALESKWRFKVEAWCRRYPASPLVAHLQSLADANAPYTSSIHPLAAWRATRFGKAVCCLLDGASDGPGNMYELDVIREVVASRMGCSRESAERALLIADAYGDPFWINAAQASVAVTEADPLRGPAPIGPSSPTTMPPSVQPAPQLPVHADLPLHAAERSSPSTPPESLASTTVPPSAQPAPQQPEQASLPQPVPLAPEPVQVRNTPDEPSLHFTYFHTFQGYTSDNQVLFPPDYSRHKVKQLLAILLLQPRLRMVRDQLMVQLFGEDYSESEGNYLHVTLHRLRELFHRQTGVGGRWAAVRKDMVLLNEDRIERVDIEEYRKLAAVGHELWKADKEAACDLYAKAVHMYHPVIAPEFEYEDWISQSRIFLEQQQRRMLKRLWWAERKAGRMDEAVQRGEQLLALDPADLTVLKELCQDWTQTGDTKTMHQICQRAIEMLQNDGDPVPGWLTATALSGNKARR